MTASQQLSQLKSAYTRSTPSISIPYKLPWMFITGGSGKSCVRGGEGKGKGKGKKALPKRRLICNRYCLCCSDSCVHPLYWSIRYLRLYLLHGVLL